MDEITCTWDDRYKCTNEECGYNGAYCVRADYEINRDYNFIDPLEFPKD